jgi:hypothetical protein
MVHNSDYYSRRAAEARVAACRRDDDEGPEIAGQLALAYAALARRRAATQPASIAPGSEFLLAD